MPRERAVMPEREPVMFIDTWRIPKGKLDAIKDAARAFVDFVATRSRS
jgi:hypothetical protein